MKIFYRSLSKNSTILIKAENQANPVRLSESKKLKNFSYLRNTALFKKFKSFFLNSKVQKFNKK